MYLAIEWDVILSTLGGTAVYSTILSVVIGGGLSYFKLWLISEEDVRNRVGLKKEVSIEKLAIALNRILQQSCHTEIPLRGDPPHHDDVIVNYISESFRLLRVSSRLDSVHIGVKNAYTTLFLTAIVGLFFMLTALPSIAIRPYIALMCYMIILVQIGMVFRIRAMAKRLEEYEHET